MTFNKCFQVLGDIRLTEDASDLAIADGPIAIRQRITNALSLFRGSCVYDRSAGVPYFQEILAAGTSPELVRQRFVRVLRQVPGVDGVPRLTVRFENQVMYVDFVVATEYGDLSDTLDFAPNV